MPDPESESALSDRKHSVRLYAVVLLLHLLGFGVLFGVVIPAHLTVGDQIFGIGLGLTAYVFGLRHAFDADHIAAIDNTTRKLVATGRRAQGVGLYFSLGHSTIVFAMAVLVALGIQRANVLVDESSDAHQLLGTIGSTVSGVFLLLIGLMNLPVLKAAWSARRAHLDALEGRAAGGQDASTSSPAPGGHAMPSGPIYRMTSPLFAFVNRDWQIYPIGVLFGLGFDTATEVALLVVAGQGSAAGLPWYAILVLPTLFAAGMSLMDTTDGILMARAYRWGDERALFSKRFIVSITFASVITALVVGVVELVGTWGPRVGLAEPVQEWFDSIDMENVGYGLVALCLVLIAGAWVASRRDKRRLDALGAGARAGVALRTEREPV